MQIIVFKTFYLILGENLQLTEGIYLVFHEAENVFDIFTCYIRTSMALVPSQYMKLCWKLQWKM